MNNTRYNNIHVAERSMTWSIKTVVTLIVCIAIPFVVGAIASLLTRDGMISFNFMNKPPLSPPAWLFPVAWSILYILMGIASFFIVISSHESSATGLVLYIVQLAFNFVWSLIFFRFEAYTFSAIWLAMLIALIVALIINTSEYSRPAMYMLIPYAAWCCFAMYLNIGIAIMN